MSETSCERLREALAGVLPGEAFIDDAEALRAYSTSSYPARGVPPAFALKPRDAGQVASIVALAGEAGANLVPVSSGPPHVKGGSAPSADGVTVDLSGMDGIVRFDRRNRVALIEPGVTFGALRDRAGEEGLRPLMPLLPRATKSVVASCLEREPAIVPKYQWDATDPLLCAEVVFGTGDLFRTGSAAGPGTLADQWALGNAQKNPMGPAATDLSKLLQGAQGTLGIVTWATVKLELAPSVRRPRFVSCDDPGRLMALARELCRLRLGDEMLVLDSVNLSRVLSCLADAAPFSVPGGARFTLVYAVAGYPGYLPGERVAYQERDIEAIVRRMGLRAADTPGGVDGEEFMRLLDGPCPGPHWKSGLEGACQDVFFLTTMDRVPELTRAMDSLAAEHGIERGSLGLYAQPAGQGRSCHLEFNIFYDPDDGAARERVRGAAAEASRVMAGMGAFFSRPFEPWVATAYENRDDTVGALRKVKGIFDPGDIMNRGKLCFPGGDFDAA